MLWAILEDIAKPNIHIYGVHGKGDELLINETNNTFYYKPVGLTKDTAKEQTEAYAKSIEGIKGLTHKIEYKDDYLTEKLTIDFSKADIEELQSKQLLQTSGNQKADYISYKETAKLLEKAGYKEVKDGKFEDLK